MSPLLGWYRPVIRLKRVVLPAPAGRLEMSRLVLNAAEAGHD
jgi:hypothetical protein